MYKRLLLLLVCILGGCYGKRLQLPTGRDNCPLFRQANETCSQPGQTCEYETVLSCDSNCDKQYYMPRYTCVCGQETWHCIEAKYEEFVNCNSCSTLRSRPTTQLLNETGDDTTTTAATQVSFNGIYSLLSRVFGPKYETIVESQFSEPANDNRLDFCPDEIPLFGDTCPTIDLDCPYNIDCYREIDTTTGECIGDAFNVTVTSCKCLALEDEDPQWACSSLDLDTTSFSTCEAC